MEIAGNKIIFNMRNVADRRPITADIFLNDYCNNRCPYCTYARYGERNGEFMSFELFRKTASALLDRGVKGLILTGGGEPTISRDFDKITEWLEANKIPYGVNTNFNVYKEIRPEYLKISLDAYDRESYIRKRGVDAYDKVRDNIKRYLDWRESTGGKTAVGVQLVAESAEEVEAFYNANCYLGVDYFNIRPMESTRCEYYKSHDYKGVLAKLEQLKKADSRVTINYKWEHLFHAFDRCYAHDLQVAINQRGQVMYCCHKPYEIIGHILDRDIWEKYAAAKTDMTMCDIPCRLTGPNEYMQAIDTGCKNSEFI